MRWVFSFVGRNESRLFTQRHPARNSDLVFFFLFHFASIDRRCFFLVLRIRKATIDYFIISYAYIILCTWCILVYTQLLTQVVCMCVCLCLKATTSWETGKRGKPNCTIHYAHRIDWFSVFIVVVLSLASPRCLLFLSFLIENADDDDAGVMDEETGHYEDQLKYRHFTGLSHR